MPSLTEKQLDGLKPPAKGRRLIFDDHRDAPRGFGVRILPSGKVVFILRYSHQGKDRQMNIGQRGAWTLAAAREQAKKLRREIDAGTDLLDQRRAERAELTVADAAERYIEAHVEDLASANDVKALFRLHIIPALGKKKLTAVRRRDVIELVEGLAKDRPRQAALVLQYFKALFGWAEDREHIEASPIASLKPAKVSPNLAPRSRSRVLSDGEIRALWEDVEESGLHRLTALALKLVLVTGQRPGEVAGMRWDEIEGRVWTIPADRRRKTDSANAVPLTDTALELLERAKAEAERLGRRNSRAGEYVFEARPGSPLTVPALGRAVRRYADALGNDGSGGYWTPHDLRRTCRTGLAAAGVDETVAEMVIGHTRKGIARVYDLHRYDAEKRKALEAWERRLHRIATGEPADDNVVSITEARG